MADYRRPVEFGANADPLAANPRLPLEVARVADAAGLELVGVQDHPYNRAFLDTWTLLATLAPQTRRVRLFPDVADLPLRPPAMLAKAVATLDVLGGGRVEVGLGAGALWDAIRAYGGPVRTPGEAVAALEEAIQVMRLLWQGQRGARFTRRHYRLEGAGLRPPSGLTRGRGLSQQPKPSPQEPDPAAVDLAHHAGMTAVQADFVALTEGG
jgi:alkanesulfonate monooxygenase SsuD/methylene tetrahydromethanopterin reductase-like flavin-dependent oxidoreductase (luciferase family)